MHQYLATLHERPHHHKQRFAMLVSGCVTLLIFALWLTFRFGSDNVVAQTPAAETQETTVNAVSPLDTMKANASDAWQLLQGEFSKAKDGLQSVDVENSYTQVRNDALNN